MLPGCVSLLGPQSLSLTEFQFFAAFLNAPDDVALALHQSYALYVICPIPPFCPNNSASLGAARAIRDKLSWPGDLLREIAESKAKQAQLMQMQVSRQDGSYNAAMPTLMQQMFGEELSDRPTMPPPKNQRIPLLPKCRRRSGREYLRCQWLDRAGEQVASV